MSRYITFRHLYGGCYVAEYSGRTFPAMGTMPDGTMCSYCNAEEAYYIPDGACGPMCGSCMDLGIERGYDQVDNLRLSRWVRAILWRISPREPTRAHTRAESVLHEPLVALQIAKYLVWCTDGFDNWRDHDYEAHSRPGPSGLEWDDPDPSPRCGSESA